MDREIVPSVEAASSEAAVQSKAELTCLQKNHCSNCFHVTAESGVLHKRVIDMNEKSPKAVSSGKQLHSRVGSMTGEQDSSAAK